MTPIDKFESIVTEAARIFYKETGIRIAGVKFKTPYEIKDFCDVDISFKEKSNIDYLLGKRSQINTNK